jgi:HAD superfamily hydrolase (TIGR01490 family)
MKDKAERVQSVAIFDLDGTLAERDTFVPFLTGILIQAPSRWPRTVPLVYGLLLYFLALRNNTWLKSLFLRHILGGISAAKIKLWGEVFADRLIASGLRAKGLSRLKKHLEAGHDVVLATASPDIYVEPLALKLGIKKTVCTRMERDINGQFTGQIEGENCKGIEKLSRVISLLDEDNEKRTVYAYSDNHADLPLLQWSNRPVLICPTAQLACWAKELGALVERW